MKMNGKQLRGPNVEVLVLPRSEEDLVFKAEAVLDYGDFDKICPLPEPPQVMRPGGEISMDMNDSKYQERLQEWANWKTHWVILESLKATKNLEWETVNPSKPETWGNYEKEMKEAGLSPPEIGRIVQTVSSACGLNQDKIDEATKRFLAGQGEALRGVTSLSTVPKNTQSGSRVSGSV